MPTLKHRQTAEQLQKLAFMMQRLELWQTIPPSAEAFQSEQPFAIDTMTANEWLQWIFIPRMQALIDSRGALPAQIAVSPYIEEALKEQENLELLLQPLIEIENLLKNA